MWTHLDSTDPKQKQTSIQAHTHAAYKPICGLTVTHLILSKGNIQYKHTHNV